MKLNKKGSGLSIGILLAIVGVLFAAAFLSSDLDLTGFSVASDFGVTALPNCSVSCVPFAGAISSSCQLNQSLLGCATDGVYINASNVVLDCQGYTISGTKNAFSYGVAATNLDNVTIKNCIVTNFGDYGIKLVNTNNSLVYNNTVYGMDLAGIYLSNADNNTILLNNASNNCIGATPSGGIEIDASDNNDILNNTANNNTIGPFPVGIYCHSNSRLNRINYNDALRNRYAGILFEPCDDNNVTYNNASENGLYGIEITSGSDRNLIAYNEFVNQTNKTTSINATGVGIETGSRNNTVLENNIKFGVIGVGLTSSSTGNQIITNNISNHINYALRFLSSSENNTIYDNNVTNGNMTVSDNTPNGNYWNTTYNCAGSSNILGGSCMGGNWWGGDYNGSDTNSDGIGDTNLPYVGTASISKGGDYLPLMQITAQPSITVNKTSSPDPVNNGTQLNYTITITNGGSGNAGNVTLTELYPGNVTFVSATPAANASNTTWYLGTLLNGTSTTVNITVLVNSTITNGTILTNRVNVTYLNSTNGTLLATAEENTTAVVYAISPEPLINVSKTPNPEQVYNGSQLNYTIYITNNGGGNATNVTVVETYPPNVTFVSSSPAPSIANHTWYLGNITPGAGPIAAVNITVLVHSNLTANINLTNNVNVSYENSTGGTLYATTTVNSTAMLPFPDLIVTKTDSADPVQPGNTFVYYITLTNNGLATAYNISLTDVYPSDFTFVSAVPTPNATNNTWLFDSLASSASLTVNVTMQVKSSATAGVKNNSVNVNYTDISSTPYSDSTSETTSVTIPSPQPTGGGGGGGTRRCTANWNCTAWSECIGNFMSRTCVDLNRCEERNYDIIIGERPALYQSCTVPATCDDGKKNQDETAVDCGGALCQPCAEGETCSIDRDCLTGKCSNGICVVPPPLPECIADVDCAEGYSCENSKCVAKVIEKEPLPSEPIWPTVLFVAVFVIIFLAGTSLAGLKIVEVLAMKKVDTLIAESLEMIPKKNMIVLKMNYEKIIRLYKKLPYKEKAEFYDRIMDLYYKIKAIK